MYKYAKISLIVFLFSAIAYTPAFAKEYMGTVTSLNVIKRGVNYDAANEGQIGDRPRLGYIGMPMITQIDEDKIIEGYPVYTFALPYWTSLVRGYQHLTKAARIQLDEVRLNLSRYNKLVGPGAVSEAQREGYASQYISAISSLETNSAMISNKYENVRQSYFNAPFEGIVTQVLISTGMAWGENIIEYTQLNPIGISVKMDRSEARKLSNKPVAIYPLGVNKPQGILYGRTLLTDDGVMFITDNFPSSTLNDPELKTRVLRDYGLVVNFNIGTQDKFTPAVNKKAINKDDKGSYVWKAADQSDMNPAKGISKIFTVSKVYITPADLIRKHAGFEEIQALKEAGSLQPQDIVIVNAPKDLKDGEQVFFPQNRYILMPGENVKVVVGE